MTQTNPPRPKVSGARNLKLLITTISLATTLSGWALIALSQSNTASGAAADNQNATVDQNTGVNQSTPVNQSAPVSQPTDVPAPTDEPEVVIPALSSLPVRGLPAIGAAAQQPAPQQFVFTAPSQSTGGSGGGGSGGRSVGGGGGGGAPPPAPKPPPAPRPPPPPVGGGTHGSHHPT